MSSANELSQKEYLSIMRKNSKHVKAGYYKSFQYGRELVWWIFKTNSGEWFVVDVDCVGSTRPRSTCAPLLRGMWENIRDGYVELFS